MSPIAAAATIHGNALQCQPGRPHFRRFVTRYFDTNQARAYHEPVMSDDRLPDRIDPVRLAEARRVLEGELSIAALPRLVSMLTDDSGSVRVDITCGVDEEGIRYLRGSLDAEVNIQCQRCLESFVLPLHTTFALGVVTHASLAERLPDHYEPLVVGEEPVFLRDIVEDELILSLPIVPKHPEGQCPAGKGGDEHVEEERRENPFAALKVLKTKKVPDEE